MIWTELLRKARITRSSKNITLEKVLSSRVARDYYLATLKGLNAQVRHVLKDVELLRSQYGSVNKVDLTLADVIAGKLFEFSLSQFVDFTSYHTFAGNIAGQVALDKIGIGGSFAIKDDRLLKIIEDLDIPLYTQLNATTSKWLSNQLAIAFKRGLSNEELVAAIQEKFVGISKNRASLIVVAEATNASNLVEQMTYQENGVAKWYWATVGDNRVTPACRQNESQSRMVGGIKIGQPFASGHTRPPRFAGCRCTTEPVLESIIPSITPWRG